MKINVKKIAGLAGHKDCIYTLERSSDHNIFYSAGGDGLVVEWDLDNVEGGKLIAKVDASVYALCYIPEVDILVVGQNFEGIHLIKPGERKAIGSLKITQSSIFDIQQYGNLLFIGTGDGSLIAVDLNQLTIKKHLKLSSSSLRSIAINHENKEIATSFSDNYIRVLDLKTLKVKSEYPAHDNSVFSIVYSPDYKYLLSGGRDAHLKIWEVGDGYELYGSIVAHMYTINHICYRPDNKYFATASMDKTLKVWDAESFKLLKVIDRDRHGGHLTSVNKLLWLDGHQHLLSGSDDRSVIEWDLEFND